MTRKDTTELEQLVDKLADAYVKAGEEERKILEKDFKAAFRQLCQVTAKLRLAKYDPDLDPKAIRLPELDVCGLIEDECLGGISVSCSSVVDVVISDYLKSIHFSSKHICLDGQWYCVEAFTDEEIKEIIQKEIEESDDDDYAEARKLAGPCEDSRKWLKRFCLELIKLTDEGLTVKNCKFQPRLECIFYYDDEGLQTYWIDENCNKWNVRNFSAEAAMKASETLDKCKFCVDCVDCEDCEDCVQCRGCRHCISCKNSVNCDDCGVCRNCNGLNDEDYISDNQVQEVKVEDDDKKDNDGNEAAKPAGRYLIIDLSGGVDAEVYPIRYSEKGPDSSNVACRTTELWLRELPAGEFMMGSPEDEVGRLDDEKQHKVLLKQNFWMGKFQVTENQYEAVLGGSASRYMWKKRPKDGVSWDEAKKFCLRLNQLCEDKLPEGYQFDLPTEAQWEYACRAGTTTPLNNRKALESQKESCPALDEVGWCVMKENSRRVGKKRPNAWGLHDMHGNVAEWCQDWYGSYGASAVDPQGPSTGTYKILRGGSFRASARYCRSACRRAQRPGQYAPDYGFRVALVPVN